MTDEKKELVTKFHCEFSKGHALKTIIDTFSSYFSRGLIRVTKEGIFLRDTNEQNSILLDLSILRQYFPEFRFSLKQPLNICLAFRYLEKITKIIKKKDSASMYVKVLKSDKKGGKDEIDRRLYVSNWSRKANSIAKEEDHVVFQSDVDKQEIELPEDSNYELGKTLQKDEFLKLKKHTTMGKTIRITMQKHYYLRFDSEKDDVYGTNSEFGQLVDAFDSDDESEPGSDSDSSSSDSESDEEETKATKKSASKKPMESKKKSTNEYPGVYCQTFEACLFSPLIKLASLFEQQTFYQPIRKGYPLKIEMQSGNAFSLRIYLKDTEQIALEQKTRHEEDVELLETAKPRRGGRGRKARA